MSQRSNSAALLQKATSDHIIVKKKKEITLLDYKLNKAENALKNQKFLKQNSEKINNEYCKILGYICSKHDEMYKSFPEYRSMADKYSAQNSILRALKVMLKFNCSMKSKN